MQVFTFESVFALLCASSVSYLSLKYELLKLQLININFCLFEAFVAKKKERKKEARRKVEQVEK